ncbi:MAG: hypothetical protein D9N11_14610 [Ketobacter sp.]|nr:MAG: hypothetical protein D9N11_14610 [Ketobacter sp.]
MIFFMSDIKLSPWYRINHTQDYVWVELLHGEHRVLSSSVLNGGLAKARHLLNLKVPRFFDGTEHPTLSLQSYAESLGAKGPIVGMMTAASMDSTRCYRELVQGIELVALVTCGLDNARRVGDPAEYRAMVSQPHEAGTINIIVLSSAGLSLAAMVEAVQMITEAKTAALMAAGISSPVSAEPATGTGTDAVAVVSGLGGEQVQYCGKHVLFGEVLGRITFNAVQDSIRWYRPPGDH